MLALPSFSLADTRFLLIDRELRQETVELASIDSEWVETRRDGISDRRRVSDLLAIVRLDESTPPPTDAPGVELIDGQRWIGPAVPGGSLDSGTWAVDFIGRLSAPLDEVRRIRLRSGAPFLPIDERTEGDRMLLANGDELTGLLISMHDGIHFEPLDGSPIRLDYHQVASISLLNPPVRRPGMMAWLAEGSVIEVASMTWSSAGTRFKIEQLSSPSNADAGFLRGLMVDRAAMVPLAQLRSEVAPISRWIQSVEEPRLLERDRPLNLADVQIRGPVEVVYDLPEGVSRFAATAVVPREFAEWADLELVILVDGRELFRAAMDGAGRSRRDILLDLSGRRLTIRVEEGGRGPIQDVVVLQRPLLRIGE